MRHFAFYAIFRVAAGLFGLLPQFVATRLGEVVGWTGYWLGGGRRTMALRHLRRVTGRTDERGARRIFAAYGRYWAEALWARPHRRSGLEASTEVEGFEHLVAAKMAGKGVVFALPHLGNWEVAGPVAGRAQLPLVAVAENLRNRYLRDWFVRLRAAFGIDIVLVGGAGGVMHRLIGVLRGNGGVALLCDRDLSGTGVPVEFFGEETTLPAGPVALALRTGATLLPVGTYFAGLGHRVLIRPPLRLPSEDIQRGTQLLAHELESLIAAAPTQWHLLQPNWPSDRHP
ncbi:MAG TPA: phosphatidylinositol mannoside acyltransferase [Acidimicrobiia bacterium]|nr:phosphatidylinositol mannoside acyltransferase [Acidimicrobiia bacterium]